MTEMGTLRGGIYKQSVLWRKPGDQSSAAFHWLSGNSL